MTFDDSRLDAPLDPLAEGVLRRLASTGARIRRDCADLDKVRRTVGECCLLYTSDAADE